MKLKSEKTHSWDVTPAEAVEIQQSLRDEVITQDDLDEVSLVAGVDVGFEDNNRTTCAAIAVLSYPELSLQDYAVARIPTQIPYIPGLLSFREIPAILKSIEKLKLEPDLFLCDGQGRAHPRRMGLASHLGVVTGFPTIGVAKSRLTGTHPSVPASKGAWVPLHEREELIGIVLRTRDNVKPLYISIGHRISLPTARKYVMKCLTRYRLPETTRWAHRIAGGGRLEWH